MQCEYCETLPCKLHEERVEEAGVQPARPQMNNEDVWWTEINKHRINIASGEDAFACGCIE